MNIIKHNHTLRAQVIFFLRFRAIVSGAIEPFRRFVRPLWATRITWDQAKAFVKRSGSHPVPLHLRNAPTKLMEQMGYHEGYRYAHDEPSGYAAGQTYFPEGVARPGWYQPTDRGVERRLGDRLAWLRSLDDSASPSAGA